jgi:hypothetical protein
MLKKNKRAETHRTIQKKEAGKSVSVSFYLQNRLVAFQNRDKFNIPNRLS